MTNIHPHFFNPTLHDPYTRQEAEIYFEESCGGFKGEIIADTSVEWPLVWIYTYDGEVIPRAS
jgi:hypothetical protein